MSEIENLLARARRYIKSGNLLLADGDYESAVSRAYYAMFYSTEALLLTKGLSYSSHKGVISAFGRHFVKTGIFPTNLSLSPLPGPSRRDRLVNMSLLLLWQKTKPEKYLRKLKNL
ncbi:MAG: hypothetical protein A3G93_13875 [Nitrospinae bacterium RIFCSPLOWO2_12_FULL_45_22]|nr:MAG: hypothetical protein A3G93_13875 [Nitrospinae bacterium RIFCSPLOWO2_12_FULL_45_22]